MSRRSGPCWPTATQERLLQVALRDREVAEPVWRDTRPEIDLDVLEIGSFALLPLIYRRLVEWQADDPDLERLKGIYRRVWYGSNLLLEETAAAAAALGAAQVDALLTEGAATASLYYDDPGLRRLEYSELLVPLGSEETAAAALSAAGYRRWADGASATRIPFTGPRGTVCVVSSAPPLELVAAEGVTRSLEPFWRDSRTADVAGRAVRVLSPTHELLVALVAGSRATVPAARVQWVADAATILRKAGGDVDWEGLLAAARERRAIPRLQRALPYVAAMTGADVPAQVRENLGGLVVTRRERFALYLNERPYGVAGGLPYSLAAHLRLTADESTLGMLRALPAFLQRAWELERPRQIPLHLARKVAKAPASALRRRLAARQAGTASRHVSASSAGS